LFALPVGGRTPVVPQMGGADGWTNVSRAPRSIVDPSRMKLTKQPDDNISLGPGGRPGASWIQGARGGQSSAANKTASQEVDRPAQTPNR